MIRATDARSHSPQSCHKCGNRLAVDESEYCLYCLDTMIHDRQMAGTQSSLERWF